jgi:hypothetical protein
LSQVRRALLSPALDKGEVLERARPGILAKGQPGLEPHNRGGQYDSPCFTRPYPRP